MTKEWEHNFDALLAWLDPDRERAGQKYEEIRENLINIFSWRGCYDAEDLADEAITRVTQKVAHLAVHFKGDPGLYFYAVARNMLWEVSRRELNRTSPEVLDGLSDNIPEVPLNDFEREYECLQECLQKLPAGDRELVLLYYQQDQPKIVYRKELGRRLGMAPNNLRVKVHRIRATLHACIVKCLERKVDDETN